MKKTKAIKKIIKRKNGITLIALVITIIVLLILAGISISALTGENGIIKKTVIARNKTGMAALREEAEMVIQSRVTEKITTGKNKNTFFDDLKTGIRDAKVEEIKAREDLSVLPDIYYVSKDGLYITVYEDGEIQEQKAEIWDGEKILCPEFKKENGVWNWYIYKPSQLKFLADFVNNGDGVSVPANLENMVRDAGYSVDDIKMSTNVTIKLMNSLDFGAREGEADESLTDDIEIEKSKWAEYEGKLNWTPIGIVSNNVKDKLGTFDGNNHSIRGIYVNRTEDYNGLFGSSNSIQNLTMKNSYIYGDLCTGGIVGTSYGNLMKLINNGVIIGTNTRTGGIVGLLSSGANISDCNNNGNVIGVNTMVGGIAGFIGSCTIANCHNNASVKGKYQQVGGIVGFANASAKLNNCTNHGIISALDNNVGGIIGWAYESCTITECKNFGNINASKHFNGGIVGLLGKSGNVDNCINIGEVSANGKYSGGIVGYIRPTDNKNNTKVEKCYNCGLIKASSCSGGIVGYLDGDSGKGTIIQQCYNKGEITGRSIGEIIGEERNQTGLNNLSKLFYLKNNKNLTAVGGESDNTEEKKIMGVDEDLTYEQFKVWIESK